MKYTISQFKAQFPTDRECLDYILKKRFPQLTHKVYYIEGRKCYADAWGRQIHPVAGTIFEKSSTPLTLWFYAIYLFSVSQNGVSAKELQRQLGVTYKCAWRMAKHIRALMVQGNDKLFGTVEVDETYYGGKQKAGKDNKNLSRAMQAKTVIAGAVERGGIIRAKIAPNAKAKTLGKFLHENVDWLTTKLMTDESNRYKLIAAKYRRQSVQHGKGQYKNGEAHTNTIEGFWGHFKKSVSGTYVAVSPQHLQSYVDEFVFRRNEREDVFGAMMKRI